MQADGKKVNSEFEKCWNQLSEGIRRIQNLEPLTSRGYFELYTVVYNFCTRASGTEPQQTTPKLTSGRQANRLQSGNLGGGPPIFAGQELYDNLGNLLKKDLALLSQNCADKSGETLLSIYAKAWEEYTFTAKVVNGIFSYLNRHYVRREAGNGTPNVFQIYHMALDVWKEAMFERTHKNLIVHTLDLLEQERLGNSINGSLVQIVISSFVELGLNDIGEPENTGNRQQSTETEFDDRTGLRVALGTYQKHFECQYLQNVREFYTKESHAFLHDEGNSVVDYMKKAEHRLIDEDARAEKYLHKSTRAKQRRVCEDTLIRMNLDAIDNEFSRLLTEELNDDMSRTYILVSKLDNALYHMTNIFKNHISVQGHLKLEGLGTAVTEPKAFVNGILEVYKKFKGLVDFCFQSDAVFKAALDQACGEFINRNCVHQGPKCGMKCSELLARYCDLLLRKCNKASEDQEIEEGQNDVMIVFKFLEDKDAFQKYYSNMFAHRLIQQLSASDDAESSMIAKLKHACGFEYTSKLQRMYQDVGLSRELQEEFKNKNLESKLNQNISDFQVQILSTSSWPYTRCPSELALPTELEPTIQAFQEFYVSKHSGRKLNWLYSRSRGELTCNCFKSKYIFQASVYQMAVLLTFNHAEELRFQEIQEATKLQNEILIQVLQGIFKSGICETQVGWETELAPESLIKLNKSYKNKKVRVNINAPLKNEARKESELTENSVEDDRKLLLQSAIVRIMKMRKTITHQLLIAEVIAQTANRFKANVPLIKKCIDMLIEKEYMERTADQKDTYSYIA